MRERTCAAAALAALLVSGVMAGASVAATGSGLGVRTQATVPDSDGGSPDRYVTLVTGDRVQLDSRNRVTGVRQAKGRAHVPVSVRRLGDDQYVVPADAAALIGQGALNKRLFDVGGLIGAGTTTPGGARSR
jgi:hypothetical protein